MSRGNASQGPQPVRCFAVWLTASAVAWLAWRGLSASALSLLEAASWRGAFEEVLVGLAAAALLCCAAWCWVVTTVTAWEVARGAADLARPQGLARRWALAACGAALAAGVASPAVAQGDRGPVLAGLPLPDRAVPTAPLAAAPVARIAPAPTGDVVVQRGDSLWAIAASTLPPDAPDSEVAARCRALYAANRAAVGDDPGLIHPGLRLRMPSPSATDE
ncbi:hypothetical protein DDE18_07225 [Nocardioides gansuensis]|uniref:Uncharacterized protein n=1 Tax=Nocardioides gansuensis TaxID=2138300 RepID=A0A2T8FBM7_9ACTN|nr:LysM peptidoglycan-binding domain-containing protein [Nocardioides gansuensis]PVG83111.1 hypothetical protein DDE18_07225 [Nocardioides gansuensis]